MKKIINFSGLILSSILLTACGGGDGSSSSNPPITDEKPNLENQQGRLLILTEDPDRPQLNLYDLAQKKNVHNAQLSFNPSAIHASAGYRYGVLMNRTQGIVNFYDSGLSLNKGNISSQTPQLLKYQLNGASPTHYRNFNDQAAIFYDGNNDQSSKFDVFKDQDIFNNSVASQGLPFKHHGVAEPRGDLVLSTYLADGQSKVSIVKSYGIHGDHFHEQQTLNNPCSGLHGASSIQKFSAFGCEDGVLVVEQQGQKFTDFKISLPVRIGTVVGHHLAPNLVALASTTPDLFIIDPILKNTNQIQWVNDPSTVRLKQIYSSSGKFFVVLDSKGVLNIFDSKTWELKTRLNVIDAQSPDLTKTQLVVNGRADEVYLNDVQNKSIIQVDLKTGAIKQTIQLNTVPNQFTWLGVGQA